MADSIVGQEITTCEMHTGGGPVRIIEKDVPVPKGDTVLAKMRYMREYMDSYRVMLMGEPRGHRDMYGAFLVPADLPGMDTGVIFMHNDGYSAMCGHSTIALGRYLIDKKIIQNPTSPITTISLQCPCGPVVVSVEYKDGKIGNVSFQSVPSYIFQRDVHVTVPGYDDVTLDIVFGGAFYAVTPASMYGLTLGHAPAETIRSAAGETTDALKEQLKLSHPQKDLEFQDGTIITDGQDEHSPTPTSNVAVFSDRQIDRSPCGSGVTARVAQQYQRGHIKLNQDRMFCSIVGSKFTARAVREEMFNDVNCVVVEVSGKGHYSGSCKFTLEEGDEIGKGFLVV